MIYTKLESKIDLKYEDEIPVYKDFINFHEDIDKRFGSNEILQYEEKDEEQQESKVKNINEKMLEAGDAMDGIKDKSNEMIDSDEQYEQKENVIDDNEHEELELNKVDEEIFEAGENDKKALRDLEDTSNEIADFDDEYNKEEIAVDALKPDPIIINDEKESDLDKPEDYDSSGCPVVPFAFSGMTGRLGNVMSTYINFIALQWKLGYKYFLPKYMNHHTWADPTKPYFSSIFKNVSFPEATWSNITVARDAADDDVILFNNSGTNFEEKACDKEYMRVNNIEPYFSDFQECAEKHECVGKSCLSCSGACPCGNIWVTSAVGANYPDFKFIGSVLDDIIKYHLQFTEKVNNQAKEVLKSVALAFDNLDDMVYVGIHVRQVGCCF